MSALTRFEGNDVAVSTKVKDEKESRDGGRVRTLTLPKRAQARGSVLQIS